MIDPALKGRNAAGGLVVRRAFHERVDGAFHERFGGLGGMYGLVVD